MPEQFVFGKDDKVDWLFIEAIGGLSDMHPVLKDHGPDKPFEVTLIVNGHEVPFSRTMRLLDDNYGRCIETRAKEIVQEQLGKIVRQLQSIQERTDELDVTVPDKRYDTKGP